MRLTHLGFAFTVLVAFVLSPLARCQDLRVDYSLVDFLKSTQRASDYDARKVYWNATLPNEKDLYKGSMIQNMRLLEALRLDTHPLPEACRIPQDLGAPIDGLTLLAIDRRSEASKADKGSYFVIFSARAAKGTSPGHAWISFALSEEIKAEKCVARTFGNFPNKGEKEWAFGRVPGDLVEGWAKNRTEQDEAHRLIVQVDSETYVAARKVLETWAALKEYELLKRDCTVFAKEVATAAGLKTNDSAFPNIFVSKLINDNNPAKDNKATR